MASRVGLAGGGIAALGMQLAHAMGATRLVSRLQAGQGCLLMFHRVTSADAWTSLPNQDFHLTDAFLGRLLDYLVETGWAVVTMEEAVSRIRDGDRGRFVNISIDDVYRDTIETALPIFRCRGLPVTLFVTTGVPDRTMTLWTAGLESILLEQDRVVLEDGRPAAAATTAQKQQLFARLAAAWESDDPELRYSRFCALNSYDPDELHDRHAVTWEMLKQVSDDPCVEIGAHTMTHARLSTEPKLRAGAEIIGCKARLQERLGVPVRHFAFPYGRRADCGEREFALTREAGFISAATTRKGLVGAADRDRLHALPRNTLNGAHQRTAHAEIHLSGLGGLIARGLGAT